MIEVWCKKAYKSVFAWKSVKVFMCKSFRFWKGLYLKVIDSFFYVWQNMFVKELCVSKICVGQTFLCVKACVREKVYL